MARRTPAFSKSWRRRVSQSPASSGDGRFGLLHVNVEAHIGKRFEDCFQGGIGDTLAAIGAGLAAVRRPVVDSVQLLQCGIGQVRDATSAVGDAVDVFIVANHQHPIFTLAQVSLNRIHAQVDRFLEGIQVIARPNAVAALMSDDQRSGHFGSVIGCISCPARSEYKHLIKYILKQIVHHNQQAGANANHPGQHPRVQRIEREHADDPPQAKEREQRRTADHLSKNDR